jgi:hypothetical protein
MIFGLEGSPARYVAARFELWERRRQAVWWAPAIIALAMSGRIIW